MANEEDTFPFATKKWMKGIHIVFFIRCMSYLPNFERLANYLNDLYNKRIIIQGKLIL